MHFSYLVMHTDFVMKFIYSEIFCRSVLKLFPPRIGFKLYLVINYMFSVMFLSLCQKYGLRRIWINYRHCFSWCILQTEFWQSEAVAGCCVSFLWQRRVWIDQWAASVGAGARGAEDASSCCWFCCGWVLRGSHHRHYGLNWNSENCQRTILSTQTCLLLLSEHWQPRLDEWRRTEGVTFGDLM